VWASAFTLHGLIFGLLAIKTFGLYAVAVIIIVKLKEPGVAAPAFSG
jgi:hypothetical protein